MSETSLDLDALIALSRARIEKGSKSFAAASRVFDSETRDAVHMLYAWCRHCDDVIDDQEVGFANASNKHEVTPRERLEALRRDTNTALSGKLSGQDMEAATSDPVFHALAYVAEKYGIEAQHPLDHLTGFEMDVNETHYTTIEDTLAYCYHVAGVVGVMMARIMGADGADTLNRASDLGIAFQLTNICRDVVDDAKIGRIYLPEEWLRGEGINPDEIAYPEHREKLYAVATRTLDLADRYYESAGVGIPRLPFRAAGAIAAARNVYRDIGQTIRECGAKAWDTRAGTTKTRKILRVGQGLFQATTSRVVKPQYARTGLWTRADNR